ncbi:hydratase [Cupriavidus pinatubonensis]|uniref:hydratase n=1 Tax=Cupriavidus pinatubonensis TaxID=248026 RepID=UPI00112C272C|nr:hydratase [Cupriavidus pinatubonensis]TPQ32015.1 hydratase [Cupriavidus pinatubonensis]
MEQAFYPKYAAHRLASASLTGLALKDLPEAERPQNLEQGYAVQSAFVEKLGEGVAGWKLAGASPRGLRGELPNSPATGTLIPSRVVESGSVIQVPPGRSATLEVEVAFRFARDVSPADEPFDASSMLEYGMLAVEVVCSRFMDRKSVGQPSFLADNIGFHALICGDKLGTFTQSSFDDEVGLWRDGELIAAGLHGDDRTRPLLSLGFLWEKLAKQGATIPQGAIVTTGTLTVPTDVDGMGPFEARLGSAKVAFLID